MKNRVYVSAALIGISMVMVGCEDSPIKIPISTPTSTPIGKPLSMSIFHINDTHSHIDSERLSFSLEGKKTYYYTGGYPRIVSKLKALKKAKPNSLTLNAGDVFQGTLYYSLFKGKADAEAMNKVGFDAYVLGNHSFDDGDSALKTFIDRLDNNISVLSANVIADAGNTLSNMWKPYVIKEVDGQKVGIVGITVSQKTKESSNPSDEITFLDELATAQKYIDELKEKDINKIILLTHQGYKYDKEMATKLNGVDVIVGGDSHTFLGNFGDVISSEGDYPAMATSKESKKVCIVQAGQYAKVLGSLDVKFDKDGNIESCSGSPILLMGDTFLQKNADGDKVEVDAVEKEKILTLINGNKSLEIVEEDVTTLAVIESYKNKVDEEKAKVIGKATQSLKHIRIPGTSYGDVNGSELPLGSQIAPIVAKSFYDLSNRADACIQNAGGVRISVPAGDVSMATAYELLPFANTLFELEMKGSEIKQVLEDALTNYLDNGGSTGSFPYAYGLKYDIDTTAEANNRIYNMEIKDRATDTWSTIDNDKMYVIVTNSYIASGKDGYTTFKSVQEARGEGVDTYLDYAMSFVRYVEEKEAKSEEVTTLDSSEHCIKSFNAKLKKLGSFKTTLDGGSEIVAFDKGSKKMFTTNGAENKIDIINIDEVTRPERVGQIDLSSYGTGVNSVAVKNGKVAVAVEIKDENSTHSKGKVVIFDTAGNYEQNVTVGYLPDMVTFNENGTKVIVANEGEPNKDYTIDPIGSIGTVTLLDGSYVEVDFSTATLTNATDGTAVRLGATPSNDKAKDIEPEYITVSGDFAYVTLQENNAMAKLNLNTNTLEYVKSFGAKSWEVDSNNTIDIEEEGEIKMKSYTGLFGLYMPDSIASFTSSGNTFLVTANEGDGREYGDFADEKKIKKLDLDSSISTAYANENDLKVMVDLGDTDSDGDYDKLYTYGARSFSIWNDSGNLVFDSGDEIGQKVAVYEPSLFNHDDGEMDGRSGNKGAEPEAITVGEIDGKTYAFVGLERQNAIMVYDITTPSQAKFVDYYRTGKDGDISPEGMKFVPASESPNGKNLLLVSYEVSGSTVIYEIK